MKHRVDMLSGSITKGLLAMTLPIMVMNVMQSLFSIFDMIVLKQFADGSAVGAVGAAGALTPLCTAIVVGLSSGANVVVARRIGMGVQKRVDNAVTTSLAVAVISGLLLMIIGAIFAKTFLIMTNCPETLLEQSTLYFTIYFYSVPLLVLYTFCGAILRAAGDARTPMYLLILGCVVKLIVTILLESAFHMGVAGVAWSTGVSNLVTAALSLIAVLKREDFRVDFRNSRFFSSELTEMLYIGILTGLQSVTYTLANVIIIATVNKFGADATTGVSIANQFDGMMYQIIHAPSLAATPYVAQNIGAGKFDRMKKAIVSSVLITTGIGAVLGAFSAIFSGQLSRLMSDSPAVIEYAQQKMHIISSTYFICGINEILSGVLRGMKRPTIPTVASLIFMLVLRYLWVYFVFPLYPNLTFLYLCWPIGWTLSIFTLLIAMRFTMPKVRAETLAAAHAHAAEAAQS